MLRGGAWEQRNISTTVNFGCSLLLVWAITCVHDLLNVRNFVHKSALIALLLYQVCIHSICLLPSAVCLNTFIRVSILTIAI